MAMDEEVEVDPECYEEHHDLDCSSYFFIEGMTGCMYNESYDMCNEEQLDCNATFGVHDMMYECDCSNDGGECFELITDLGGVIFDEENCGAQYVSNDCMEFLFDESITECNTIEYYNNCTWDQLACTAVTIVDG